MKKVRFTEEQIIKVLKATPERRRPSCVGSTVYPRRRSTTERASTVV
jgi:hypothetical protein